MKYLFSFLLFALLTIPVWAQSPFSIVNSRNQEAEVRQVSLGNPWVGAKLSYNINGDQPIDDNFLFSAKVLYTPVSGSNYAIPIVTSAGLGSDNLVDPESGFNIGVYPFYSVVSKTNFQLIIHGGVGYKVITNGTDEGDDPQQIKLLGGLEVAFWPKDGGLPFTVSVAPTYLYHTQDNVDNTSLLQITGIIPIANGLGLLADVQVPLDNLVSETFRFGVIVNGIL